MKLSATTVAFALGALACGACGAPATVVPPTTPTTTSAVTPIAEADAPVTAKEEPAPSPAAAPAAPAPAQPEACDEGWVCVKINLATGKVEKRATKLMGDPTIESTWSKQSDGRTVSFDEYSKGPVELTLRRYGSKKNDVVVHLAKGGPTVVIDKHDGDANDFTHVGVIATEQDGALLIDMRYMR